MCKTNKWILIFHNNQVDGQNVKLFYYILRLHVRNAKAS